MERQLVKVILGIWINETLLMEIMKDISYFIFMCLKNDI